jgi:hypothetical protein
LIAEVEKERRAEGRGGEKGGEKEGERERNSRCIAGAARIQ